MNKLICIVCPVGCHLTAEKDGNITGNRCKRGEVYGRIEVTNPKRTITSTVATTHPDMKRLSVKTKEPVSKKLMFEVIKALDEVLISTNTYIGDVVYPNICNTGVDIVATSEILFKDGNNK